MYNLAKMYMRNKMYKQALVYFKKTLEVEPENAIVYYMLGLYYEYISLEYSCLQYEYLNLQKESMECYRRAFELSPHQNTFDKLCNYYEKNGEYSQLLKYV